MRNYYLECFKMWLRWIKPTSPFIASISFIAMIAGLVTWVITKIGDFSPIAESVSFGVFLGGLAISVIMLLFVAPAKLWSQDKPLRELKQLQERTPRDFVFPYIRSVNAYPVIDGGENYISICVYFPSALNDDLELNIFDSSFVINGISLDLKPKSLTILKHAVSNISDWHIDLTKQALDLVKKAHAQNDPVHIALHLRDRNNKQYWWDTQEWTTLLLTKVS